MAKILLVEDDSNLREIYGARLEAEGYEITSASDGEEALAIAVKERPDLIISDVMMPKISGFDMLDILRSTPETKNVKVIVMTALSQDEDRERGEQLGADRYLVKSQVTLDDVVSITREVLASTPTPGAQPTLTADPANINQSTQPGVTDSQQPDEDASLQTDQTAPEPVQQDATTVSAADAASLNQEVEQFVANSPLMNGTPPNQPTEPAATPEPAPSQQLPPQQPPAAS